MYGTRWISNRLIPLQVISPLDRYRLIVRMYELQAVQQLYLIVVILQRMLALIGNWQSKQTSAQRQRRRQNTTS